MIGRRIALVLLLALMTIGSGVFSSDVSAADARKFNAGRIIDDSVFTNSGSMTVSEIQAFLTSKVTCDKWGTKPSEFGGGTRAQFAQSYYGVPTPFTCLPDYYENTSTGVNNYGKSTRPSGSISAAQIIYNYSKQFNINPQVIIVTLQKEMGLVTDEWPMPKQYSEAMGFGCPDNVAPGAPACDPTYKSFSTQIYQAARHFRGYIDNNYCNDNWCTPKTTGNNAILWNPNQSCGTSTVNIENRSTVALYSYTPYRPNQAALNAQYGTGDGCSAYGNRNFYLYFTDWFGSVHGAVQVTTPLTMTSSMREGVFTNKDVTLFFTLKNTTGARIDIGNMSIAARNSSGVNYDFGTQRIVIDPGKSYTYKATRQFSNEDTYTFWITNYRDGIGWNDNYPSSINSYSRRIENRLVQHAPTITKNPTAVNELRAGKSTLLEFNITNNSAYPVKLGKIGLASRTPSGKNSDLLFQDVNALAGNATYVYSQPYIPKEDGAHNVYISSTHDGGKTWNEKTFPLRTQTNDGRETLSVKPSPTLTQGPLLDIETPRAGQNVTASFKVRNYSDNVVNIGKIGIAVRDPDGKNVDVGSVNLSSLTAGQEYTYSGSRAFTKPGTYTAWITVYRDGKWDDTTYPTPESAAVKRKMTFTVKPSPTLTQGPVLDITTPRVGQSVAASFKVRNYSDSAVNVGKIGIAVRDPDGKNVDVGSVNLTNLAAGQEYTFSGSRSFTKPGTYTAWVTVFHDGKWDNTTYPTPESTAVKRKITFTVKPSPTLTQGISMGIQPITSGQSRNGTFSIHNYGSEAVNIGGVAIAIRGPNGLNRDMALKQVVIQPGQAYTYTDTKVFTVTGTYTAWITVYRDGKWDDTTYPTPESTAVKRKMTFTVNP